MDRREFLRRGAAGALILGGVPVDAWARRGRRPPAIPFAREGAFAEGIAAGAPKPRGIILWTRLDGAGAGDRRLRLEVARDREFRRTVLRRDVVARAAADGTVKVRVEGRRLLAPGEEYFYRFETRSSHSPVGRFKTLLPPDSRQPVRIAFFSCQDWQAGWYGAHRVLAGEDVDLVVCLGDYVYERNFYESTPVRRDTLGANRDGEVQTLDEWRAKYRLYKSDADLRALHEAHPFVAIWDDHEVEDNYAGAVQGLKTQQRRIPFLQRRANGWRAWDEYMPFEFVGRGTRIYRNFRIGRNAELFLLDQRQYRDDQCTDTTGSPCPDAETKPRKYLGDAQKAWFKRSLQGSGARWKMVGNQLMIMSLDAPNGNTLNADSWDGYGVERREVLEHFVDKGIRDVAFMAGDIHLFGAGDVGIDGRGPESVATEFVCGSTTSLSPAEGARDEYDAPIPPELAQPALDQVRHFNPHVRHADQGAHGYAIAEARERELLVRFVAVPTAPARSTEARTLARFRVAAGTPRVEVL